MIIPMLTSCCTHKKLCLLVQRGLNQVYFHHLNTNFTSRIKSNYIRTITDFIPEDVPEVDGNIIVLKNLLYPNSKDLFINALNKCETLEEVLKVKNNNTETLTKEQLCQLVLIMWEHNKYSTHTIPKLEVEEISRLFDDQKINALTCDELSTVLMYLNKLELSVVHPVLQSITEKCLEHMKNDKNFPLTSLSRLTVALNSEKGLYSQLMSIHTLPWILKYLEKCDNAEDLRLITISLNNIHVLITQSVLSIFKTKVDEFLNNKTIDSTSTRCVLKIINFLNYPHWSQQNTLLLRRLLLTLKDNIKNFETRELVIVNRAFQSQLESASLIPEIVKRSKVKTLMQKSPNVELLSLAVLYSNPEQRIKITEMLKDFIYSYQISSNQTGATLQTLFKILRLLKISDLSLCDSYWTKVVNEIHATKESDMNYRISKHLHRYMHFNNNLGGTYRHLEFEKSIIEVLMQDLKAGNSAFIPKDFAKFSSFIIAYGDNSGKSSIPDFIIKKIEDMQEQFSALDCLQLSRGLQILYEMRFRRYMPEKLGLQIKGLQKVLDNCAVRHMTVKDLTLSDMNCIIRSYNNRKAPKDTKLFHNLIHYYEKPIKFNLNSRSIRDIIFNLIACGFKMDNICNQFIDYILENSEHVTGETVEKIIYCCYSFGYFPEKIEVFDKCSEIILRDFEYMNGLSIVQALLALTFYKSCPESLISRVFSTDFIKRLQQEIEMCYSRASYPSRVLNLVMQLNRAICLDCPELNIPWFQQNYIEAQMSKLPVISSKIHLEVIDLLVKITGDAEYLRINQVTPYGYRVDFELLMDNYQKFMKPLEESTTANKVAILLLRMDMFCDNDINRLRGPEVLRTRHLEMLGYRVIHIKIGDYNSLYHNMGAKINYLKNLLQLTT